MLNFLLQEPNENSGKKREKKNVGGFVDRQLQAVVADVVVVVVVVIELTSKDPMMLRREVE